MRLIHGVFWAIAIFVGLTLALALLAPVYLHLDPSIAEADHLAAYHLGERGGEVAMVLAVVFTIFGTRAKLLPYTREEFKAARKHIPLYLLVGIGSVVLMMGALFLTQPHEAPAAPADSRPLAAPKTSKVKGDQLTLGSCGGILTAPKGWAWTKVTPPRGEAYVCVSPTSGAKILVAAIPTQDKTWTMQEMQGYLKGQLSAYQNKNMHVTNTEIGTSDAPFRGASYRISYSVDTPEGGELTVVQCIGFINSYLLSLQSNEGDTSELDAMRDSIKKVE